MESTLWMTNPVHPFSTSLAHLPTLLLTRSDFHFPTHSHPHSLSPVILFPHSSTRPLTHARNTCTHPPTHSLTHSLTHPPFPHHPYHLITSHPYPLSISLSSPLRSSASLLQATPPTTLCTTTTHGWLHSVIPPLNATVLPLASGALLPF